LYRIKTEKMKTFMKRSFSLHTFWGLSALMLLVRCWDGKQPFKNAAWEISCYYLE